MSVTVAHLFSFYHLTESTGGSWSTGPCEGPAHGWEPVLDPDGEPTSVDVVVAPGDWCDAWLLSHADDYDLDDGTTPSVIVEDGWLVAATSEAIRDAIRAWVAAGCPGSLAAMWAAGPPDQGLLKAVATHPSGWSVVFFTIEGLVRAFALGATCPTTARWATPGMALQSHPGGGVNQHALGEGDVLSTADVVRRLEAVGAPLDGWAWDPTRYEYA